MGIYIYKYHSLYLDGYWSYVDGMWWVQNHLTSVLWSWYFDLALPNPLEGITPLARCGAEPALGANALSCSNKAGGVWEQGIWAKAPALGKPGNETWSIAAMGTRGNASRFLPGAPC
jgi:hypothetical protein